MNKTTCVFALADTLLSIARSLVMFLAWVIVDFTQPNKLYFVRQARLIFPFSKAAFLVFGVRKFNFEEATRLPFLDASLMPRFLHSS